MSVIAWDYSFVKEMEFFDKLSIRVSKDIKLSKLSERECIVSPATTRSGEKILLFYWQTIKSFLGMSYNRLGNYYSISFKSDKFTKARVNLQKLDVAVEKAIAWIYEAYILYENDENELTSPSGDIRKVITVFSESSNTSTTNTPTTTKTLNVAEIDDPEAESKEDIQTSVAEADCDEEADTGNHTETETTETENTETSNLETEIDSTKVSAEKATKSKKSKSK